MKPLSQLQKNLPEPQGVLHRPLGETGLKVSAISVGTVSLGMSYGIPSLKGLALPQRQEAVDLLCIAAQLGINLYDTAPTYGHSQRLLGEALGARADCYLATKITPPPAHLPAPLRCRAVRRQLEQNRRELQREVLDIVQLHNADLHSLQDEPVLNLLRREKEEGRIRLLGASVYGVPTALQVLERGCFDLLQVAFNLLDQRMAEEVFPKARRQGVGLLVRSAFLKGVLTPQARYLPPELQPLMEVAERACRLFDVDWEELPSVALRFCLSQPDISSVLVGIRSWQELEQAVVALREGPLPADLRELGRQLALQDERLVNPCHWPLP